MVWRAGYGRGPADDPCCPENPEGSYARGDMLSNIENVMGSSHDDVLIGNEQVNELYGGDGDDELTAVANTAMVLLLVLTFWLAAPAMMTLIGSANADVLMGGGGHDTITGNGGADRIVGGAGDDVMTGGDGVTDDTLLTHLFSALLTERETTLSQTWQKLRIRLTFVHLSFRTEK